MHSLPALSPILYSSFYCCFWLKAYLWRQTRSTTHPLKSKKMTPTTVFLCLNNSIFPAPATDSIDKSTWIVPTNTWDHIECYTWHQRMIIIIIRVNKQKDSSTLITPGGHGLHWSCFPMRNLKGRLCRYSQTHCLASSARGAKCWNSLQALFLGRGGPRLLPQASGPHPS